MLFLTYPLLMQLLIAAEHRALLLIPGDRQSLEWILGWGFAYTWEERHEELVEGLRLFDLFRPRGTRGRIL